MAPPGFSDAGNAFNPVFSIQMSHGLRQAGLVGILVRAPKSRSKLIVRRDFGALTSIQDGLHSAAGFISWAAGQVLAGSVAFGTLGFMAYICWFG